MSMRPGLGWVATLVLTSCGGDALPARACDRLGLLCAADDNHQPLALTAPRNVTADLDADGHLDLVTAAGPAGLSIAWSRDPPLTSSRDYRLSAGDVTDTRVADRDADGDLDIAFITDAPAALHILTGNGTRQLDDGPSQGLTGHPRALWLGHLDADASLDAAVASSGDEGTLTVLTDGLTRATPITVGRELVAVDVGDFNHDDRLDLVALDHADAAFHLVLATGDSFAPPRRVATGLAPAYLQLHDLDGDANLDILTHGQGPEIWFHAGDGAGSFAPARALQVQDEQSPGFGAHRDEQGRRWLLTIGADRLVAHLLDDADQVTRRVRAGGILDFTGMTMDAGQPLTHGPWLGERHSLAAARIFSEQWHGDVASTLDPVIGDLDLDGRPELVFTSDRDLVAYHQLPDASWAELSRLALDPRAYPRAIADVTGDDLPDLVLSSDDTLRIAVGVGDGSFTLADPTTVPATSGRFLAGPAHDGGPRSVLFASNAHDQSGAVVLRFDPAGLLLDTTPLVFAGTAQSLAIADVDRDGQDDLVALARTGDDTYDLTIVPATTDGWGPPRARPLNPVLPDPRNYIDLAVGDLDQDDTIDAVIVNQKTIARFMDIGSDLPLAPLVDEGTIDAETVAIADVDADGRPDLAICSHSGVAVALLHPGGELEPQLPFDLFVPRCVLHVDPDDLQPLAIIADDDAMSVLTPDRAPALASVATFRGGPATAFTELATGDLDADGHPDIVVGTAGYDPESSFAVLWGSPDGRPRRATWHDASLFTGIHIAVAPLDDQPGDELVVAQDSGYLQIHSHADGALTRSQVTSVEQLYSISMVGVQARAAGPSDIVVLGEFDDLQSGVVALPRTATGEFVDPAESVLLWSGVTGIRHPDLTIADFDADGFDDIVVSTALGAPLQLLWGDPARLPGSQALEIHTSPYVDENLVSAADMDGDGVPELIVANTESVVGHSLRTRELGPEISYLKSSAAEPLLFADLESDGQADILRAVDDTLSLTLRAPGRDDLRAVLIRDPPWQTDGETRAHLRAADLDSDGILDLIGLQNGNLVTRLSAPTTTEVP